MNTKRNTTKRDTMMVVIMLMILAATIGADEPDQAAGPPKLNDRVIFFSFEDGQVRRNAATVIDDVNAAAELSGHPIEPGQRVNLRISANGRSRTRDYEVFLVKRGREVGQYEALTTSNH